MFVFIIKITALFWHGMSHIHVEVVQVIVGLVQGMVVRCLRHSFNNNCKDCSRVRRKWCWEANFQRRRIWSYRQLCRHCFQESSTAPKKHIFPSTHTYIHTSSYDTNYTTCTSARLFSSAEHSIYTHFVARIKVINRHFEER